MKNYIVKIKDNNTPLYLKADNNSSILQYCEAGLLFTIVDEINGFGKILKNKGWLNLS